MRVLGIDPGLASMGYGVVEGEDEDLRVVDYGVLATPAGAPTGERLRLLYQGLVDLLQSHRPSEVAIELFVARNLRPALAVGQARGMALLAAAQQGLPVYEYTPQRVKHLVAGYGRGTKGQVQEMVRLQLGLDFTPQPDDAADALAVALCHLRGLAQARLLRAAEGLP